MATKKKIYIKPSKRGSLRKAMGAKKGKKLSVSAMRSRLKGAGPAMRKKLQFALNARKWKYELGGELPIDDFNFNDAMGSVAQGVGIAGMVMNPIIQGIRGIKDARMQDIYNDASRDLRKVDVRKMGNLNKTFIGLLSGKKGREQAERFNEDIEDQIFDRSVASRLSNMPQAPTYAPVAKQGGFIVYNGQTHEGPDGGILTDEFGNPSAVSKNKPIALTEKDEVARYNPHDHNTYIYSDSLGFAKPANDLVNKHKLNKDSWNNLYKNDILLRTAVDKQFDNLMTAQEFTKETGTPSKETFGMFGKGGSLTSAKAKEMLRDGTAHGKKLTARQKRYFGWIAGGRKQEGGELINIKDNRVLDMVTGKPMQDTRRMHAKVTPDYVKSVAQVASEYGVNPYTALAINLQETGFNPDEMHNPFRLGNYNPQGSILDESMKFMSGKNQLAKRLGKTSEEDIIQAWNGYGSIGKTGEKFYGMEAPINMSENPVYGKRVVNLRDSVIMQNPEIRKIIGYEKGGYIRKRKNPAAYPFLPIPKAPVGAYSHSAAAPMTLADYGLREGGSLPRYQDGEYLPSRSRISQELRNLFGIGYSPSATPWNRNTQDPTKGMYTEGLGMIPSLRTSPLSTNSPELYFGKMLPEVSITGERPGIGTGTSKSNTPALRTPTTGTYLGRAPISHLLPSVGNMGLQKSNIPVKSTSGSAEESFTPWLNPMGQIASMASGFLDYNRLKKAAPKPVKLQRAAAEKISLAKQRLANIRNAEAAKSVGSSNARNLGLNAGQAYSNMATNVTGVNRLLGQQNAELLEREEATNAAAQNQMNALNAELAAQETLFNTQQENAYRMLLAENDPWANAAEAVGSYFIDNARYQRDYDTMKMFAPNAEVYPSYTKKGRKKLFSANVRLKGK